MPNPLRSIPWSLYVSAGLAVLWEALSVMGVESVLLGFVLLGIAAILFIIGGVQAWIKFREWITSLIDGRDQGKVRLLKSEQELAELEDKLREAEQERDNYFTYVQKLATELNKLRPEFDALRQAYRQRVGEAPPTERGDASGFSFTMIGTDIKSREFIRNTRSGDPNISMYIEDTSIDTEYFLNNTVPATDRLGDSPGTPSPKDKYENDARKSNGQLRGKKQRREQDHES